VGVSRLAAAGFQHNGLSVEFQHNDRRIVFAFVLSAKASPLAGKVKEEGKWRVTVEGLPPSDSGVLTLRDAALLNADSPLTTGAPNMRPSEAFTPPPTKPKRRPSVKHDRTLSFSIQQV
jgi:hypothetical protein